MKTNSKRLNVAISLALYCVLFSTVAFSKSPNITYLHQSDFDEGTYIINESGYYRLAENISFNPHPPGTLGSDGITVLDAYSGGNPFPSQKVSQIFSIPLSTNGVPFIDYHSSVRSVSNKFRRLTSLTSLKIAPPSSASSVS